MNRLLSWRRINSLIGFLAIFLILTSAEHSHAGIVKNKNTGAVFNDLQVAINAANSGDTLLLKGRFVPELGFEVVNKSLTLRGVSSRREAARRATLDGARRPEVSTIAIVESVPNTVSVTLQNLLIENGNGAAGGGINNNATLTLIDTEVVSNHGFSGGGIFNIVSDLAEGTSAGTLNIIRSRVTANNADETGGGIVSLGLIDAHAILNVVDSEISYNSAVSSGGGIHAISTNIVIADSRVEHNRGSNGGGLFNEASLALVRHSRISENTATISGGGIYNLGLGLSGEEASLVVRSSRIHKNLAVADGGGLYNQTAAATLIDSSVRENTALNGGGIAETTGSQLDLTNTTVLDNTPNELAELLL